ncbi:uncharacterized protein A4U43_C08F4860 [Asparagus officinalis]|nr:uncharacterized protein A4U43_C08F4860 [Asparagus officinalis]
MASREGFVYIAKLAKQDEHYDGKISRFRSRQLYKWTLISPSKNDGVPATPEDPSKRKFRYVSRVRLYFGREPEGCYYFLGT